MNAFIAICIIALVSLPMSMGLNCYQCSAFSSGCNDPFNKLGSGVSQTGENSTNTYCKKMVALSVVTRSGDTSCTSTGFYLSSGTACCQTDLCNGARANNQMPLMWIIGIIAILAKIQLV